MQLSTTPTQQRIDRALACRYRIADHREAWPRILPGLESLQAQHPDQDWTIAGIREMLDEERGLLLTDDADASAFAVVRFDPYPYSDNESELFVFLLWHQGGDVIERFQPHLEAFALLGGARFLRFYSRRPAFLRIATAAGYELRGIEYIKELGHGRR